MTLAVLSVCLSPNEKEVTEKLKLTKITKMISIYLGSGDEVHNHKHTKIIYDTHMHKTQPTISRSLASRIIDIRKIRQE